MEVRLRISPAIRPPRICLLYTSEGQRALVDRIAMKHLGTADDIANAVVFFASDLAGFVNGQILSVDGGR